MKEIFKDIPSYEGYYQISNFGTVKGLSRKVKHPKGGHRVVKEKILNPSLNTHGYLKVALCKDGKQKTHFIHKLVAMAFLGHQPCGHKLVIDHKNNNQLDNRLENLQIVTNRENCSKDKKGFSSKYVGVFWDKHAKKWRASIKINGKIKYLGSFECEIEAHKAYQQELKKIER